MRLQLMGCMLVLIFAAVLAEPVEETSDKEQEEEDYDDITVAESQDIAHAQLSPNSNGDLGEERPRSRPRGRKRRRRLRKRPRSTTPSFIEEYDPDQTVKGEHSEPVEEEVYPRRRPGKRRRRPSMRKPEYESVEPSETELMQEPKDERSPEYHRPRNGQRRRRRKGGRKRMRLTTEPSEYNTETHEDISPDVTTQYPEVVMQSNSFRSSHGDQNGGEINSSSHQDESISPTFSSAFTPKEITEINHKIESFSTNSQQLTENDYQVSGLGAFSVIQHSSAEFINQNHEDNHINNSSTTRDYAWITRFDPHAVTKSSTEKHLQPEKLSKHEKVMEMKTEPKQNIKNIEKIIENRKSLFSTSKRLPQTSAVIRRRLRPRNSTITQETITDNTIPTIDPKLLKTDRKSCQGEGCTSSKEINITALLSNSIIPSALLPSGFPTMPEILSTAELIQKISQHKGNDQLNIHSEEPTKTELPHQENNLLIITPSTLVISANDGENSLNQDKSEMRVLNEFIEPTHSDTESATSQTEQETKVEEITIISSTESTSIMTKTTTENIAETTISHSGTEKTSPEMNIKEKDTSRSLHKSLSSESEKFTLDGVDVSNINDEILELIMDEMGKARVKRILELRNMTLSELIAHRERGAGHFTSFTNENISKSIDEESDIKDTSEIKVDRKIDSIEDINDDEEQTETMIVEKAKHFLREYKKGDELLKGSRQEHFSKLKSSLKKEEKIENYGHRIQVEGTVIPVPILEPTHTSAIQFPSDRVLGDFPKYMYDIAGKRFKPNQAASNLKHSLYTEPINKPKDLKQFNNEREPRVFESMPKFSSETSSKENLEISPFPDWRITVSKSSTEKNVGFPGISKEIQLVATSATKSRDLDEIILLDEGDEEAHHLRNHIVNMNVESRDTIDDDYPEKKVPAGVKSAIAASGALLGMAIFGFLAVLVSCKIRQRRARLRVRRDILDEQFADDFRSSQRSLTPVLMKSPFNHTIHSNTASNRHYYLWRTLRKTFQYE